MSASDGSKYRFAGCELDVAARELRRNDELVALEPRVFDLLAYLIAERQRAVDKDDIQAAIWRGAIVSETALTRAIMKARRAVGDSADRQDVIRTVHGHGYQFVAELANTAPAESAAVAVTAPTTDGRPRSGFVALVAAALAVVLAVAIWQWPRGDNAGPVHLAVLPLVNGTGDPELDWIELGLMGLVTELLAADGRFGVATAASARQAAMALPAASVADPAADSGERVAQLKRALGTNHMLESRLTRLGGALHLKYTLTLPGGAQRTATMVGGEPADLAREMAASVARELAPAATDAGETYVISDDPFINEAYSRALGLSLEGRCAEALPLYDVVAKASPGFHQVRYEWARCAAQQGQTDAARAAYEAVLADTAAAGPSTLRSRTLHGLGVLLHRSGERELAAERYNDALAEAKAIDDWMQQGRVLNSMAYEARDRRELAEARELIALAFVAHRSGGAEIMPGHPYAALANFDMAEGLLDDADEHLGQALASFRALGDRRNEAMMLNNRGYLRRLQGRSAEAEPFHLQSLAIRREIGDTVGQGRILGMLSVLYTEEGRLDDAEAAASEAYTIAERSQDKLFMATSQAQLGDVARTRGAFDAAATHYTHSQTLFESLGDTIRAAQAAVLLARVDADRGQLEQALAKAVATREATLADEAYEPAIEALELEGDVEAERERFAAAVAAYTQALDVIDLSRFVSREIPIVQKLARLHLGRGDAAAAEPWVGILIEREASVDGLLLEAHYYQLGGDAARASERIAAARALAGERWTDSHEATRKVIVGL